MKRRTMLSVVLIVAVLAAGGWYWWDHSDGEANEGVMMSGTVEATQSTVTALVNGRVVEAVLAEGDEVATGQVLYRIDDSALQLQAEQAAAGVRAAKAAYDQAVSDDKSRAEIAAALALWEQAQAAEKIAGIQLGYATVSSPATGTVTSIAIRSGELASPGRTLATITQTDDLFVRAFVSELEIGAVSVGSKATAVTDAGETVECRVTFIASHAQFTPNNVETREQRVKLVYEVRLKPDSAEGLTPGLPVTVTLGS